VTSEQIVNGEESFEQHLAAAGHTADAEGRCVDCLAAVQSAGSSRVPVEGGSVGGPVEGDVIEAAAAAIEARLRLYGDPAAGSIGWGASTRELAQVAYPVIAAAVRAQERQRITDGTEAAKPHIPPSYDPKRRESLITRSTLNRALRIVKGQSAAPVAAPTEPACDGHVVQLPDPATASGYPACDACPTDPDQDPCKRCSALVLAVEAQRPCPDGGLHYEGICAHYGPGGQNHDFPAAPSGEAHR
jgi:hypothetical protein